MKVVLVDMPARLPRVFSLHHLLFTSIFATVISYRVLGALFGSQAWVLNNDHLIPFDHIRLILADDNIGVFDIAWARIPSLFPDYLLAFFVRVFSGGWITQFSAYWHIQIFCCVSAFLLLARLSCGLTGLYAAAGVYTFLVCFFPAYAEIIFYSGLPVYHGGNFVNVALVMALLASLSAGDDFKNVRLSVLFIYSLIASFSSRLFFVQLLAPLWVFLLLRISVWGIPVSSVEWRNFRSSKLARSLVLISIASIGGLIVYPLVIHQCTDVGISARFDVFASHFHRLGERGLLVFCLLSYLPLALDLWRLRSILPRMRFLDSLCDDRRETFFYLFIAVSSLFTVFVFYVSAVDSWSGYGRYLITPAYFLPVASILSVKALSRCRFQAGMNDGLSHGMHENHWCQKLKPLRSFSWAMTLSVALSALFIPLFVRSVASSAVLMRNGHHSPADWLVEVLKSNDLLDELGYVVDPPFESRALYALSNMRIRALSVSTDGNPLMFPHQRAEYLSQWSRSNRALDPRSRDVLAPKWILASPSNTRRLFRRLGAPVRVFGCKDDACVYEFDQSRVVENGAKYFSTIRFDVYKCKSDSFRGLIISKVAPFYYWLRGLLPFSAPR